MKYPCKILLHVMLYALRVTLLPITDDVYRRLSRLTAYCLRFAVFSLLTAYGVLPAVLSAQAGWGPDVRLTYFWGYSYDPKAACCGDTIHMVWWESYAHEEVFYKRSTDAGETWEADLRLSEEDTQTSVKPQIAVSKGIVHVIWFENDYGLCYRRSLDCGTTWQDIDSIVPGMTYASIQAVNDTVYIAGTIGSLGVLRFTKSYDGGSTWQPIIEITKASSSPRIRTISDNALSLVITYDKGGSPISTEVFHVCSYNGGETWLDSVMVSHNDSIHSFRSAMAVDTEAGIFVDWADYKYSPYPWTGDIFYRTSRDSGNTWEDIDSLTTQHRAVASDILAEGNNLHLVWDDDRNGFGENEEIYYRMSTDLGQTWGIEVRLTDALCHSRDPSLACDGNYLHLFWSDLRDDSNNIIGEIYYKRKDLSQGVAETTQSALSPQSRFDVCPTLFTEKITIKQSAWCLEQRSKKYSMNNDPMPYALCVKVYAITGKKVMKKEETVKKENSAAVQIDTEDLPCGVYFVELQAGSIKEVYKVVKVK